MTLNPGPSIAPWASFSVQKDDAGHKTNLQRTKIFKGIKILNKRIESFDSLLFVKNVSSGTPHSPQPWGQPLRGTPHLSSAATANTRHRDGQNSDVNTGKDPFWLLCLLLTSGLYLIQSLKAQSPFPHRKSWVRHRQETADAEVSSFRLLMLMEACFLILYSSTYLVCVHVWGTNCSSRFSPSTLGVQGIQFR